MNLDKYCNSYLGDKADIEERFLTKATIELVKKYVVGKNVLNLGLGNGFIGKTLDSIVAKQTIIEGSSAIIEKFSFESQNTVLVKSFFEDFNPKEKFDVILANHVIEHVEEPVLLMRHQFTKWLEKDGIVFITVPNAGSIHRLIGKQMGLLESVYDLNESDIKAGHKRVYDIARLSNDICRAGLEIIDFGGYNLKLVSLKQMKDWNQDLLDAIFEVSKAVPSEICANLWFILTKR